MKNETFSDECRRQGLKRCGIWLSHEDWKMLNDLMQDWHQHSGDLVSDLIKAEHKKKGGKK